VFFAELADALAVPTFTHRLSLYVGHDGTLVRLLGALGAIPLRWPSFGSEVVRFGRRLSVSVVGVSYAYFMKARSFVEWNGYNWMSL